MTDLSYYEWIDDHRQDLVAYSFADVQATAHMFRHKPKLKGFHAMRSLYRDINLPVDDSTLPDLEGLTKEDIIEAFRLVTPRSGITRSINHLHNRRKERQSKEIKAWQLVNNGFEAMAEIQLMVDNFDIVTGRITNARDIANGDTIAITILGGLHMETTWSVHRDDTVRIWPKKFEPGVAHRQAAVDYDKPADHGFLRASYIAENLSTFFGKRISVKNVGEGILNRIEVEADDPEVFHFDLGIVRNVKVHKDSLVQVYKTLEPVPYCEVRAQAIKMFPHGYLGLRVVFDDDRVDGRLEEVQRVASQSSSVNFVVNGERSQLHLGETVKVYPADRPGITRPGRNPFLRQGKSYGGLVGSMFVPDDRPDYRGDSWWFFNNGTFEGKTVQLGSSDPAKSGVKGACTQVTYENGKLIFVIDGRIYKRNRHTTVRVWDKKEN